MLQRFLLLWLLISSLVALYWPAFEVRFDPFLAAGNYGIRWLLVAIMFCVGLLLPVDEVNALRQRWPAVIGGTAIQYTCMPLVAWIMVLIFQPDPETAAGIMIVGCVPGAMASNVLTLAAHGNVSYSVSLTTSATLLSPLVVPVMLGWAVSDDISYDGGEAVKLLVLRVVLPVIGGHLVRRLFPLSQRQLEAAGVIANLAILAVIAIAVAGKRADLASVTPPLLGLLAGINLTGYLAGYLGGFPLSLPEQMRRALTLEVGMQNAGAGTALAIELFGESSPAVTPCIVYTFGCMLTGTILATFWNWRPVPDINADQIE